MEKDLKEKNIILKEILNLKVNISMEKDGMGK